MVDSWVERRGTRILSRAIPFSGMLNRRTEGYPVLRRRFLISSCQFQQDTVVVLFDLTA